jgi:hypothetical protein
LSRGVLAYRLESLVEVEAAWLNAVDENSLEVRTEEAGSLMLVLNWTLVDIKRDLFVCLKMAIGRTRVSLSGNPLPRR